MKKLIALLLAVMMVASVLAACGGNTKPSESGDTTTPKGNVEDPFYGEDNITLLVWAADNATQLTKSLCDEFIAKYPNKKITISVETQGEGDAAGQVINDADKAADVFSFACDQINKLQKANALAPVLDDYKEDVISRNTEFSVSTATLKDQLYAYPETGENGYYLVYDKRVVSDEQAKTLEGVLEACKAAGMKFVTDAGDGFYACMFPFTGGLKTAGITDEGDQLLNDYKEDEVLDSLEAFAKLFHDYSDTFMSANPTRIGSGMAENPQTVAAGIDGSWNAAIVSKTLGENYGAAKLPTININGKDTQIISMNGAKLIGVNSHSKFPEAAQLLADFLTNEASQTARLEELNWLPSNKAAADSDTVKNNKALSALLDQSQYSVPQINVTEAFWAPWGTLGSKVLVDGKDISRDNIKKEFEDAVKNVLNQDE
jgi:arabinogalactan oligomer/maltooligosaccharide transport system substrate-binding protein